MNAALPLPAAAEIVVTSLLTTVVLSLAMVLWAALVPRTLAMLRSAGLALMVPATVIGIWPRLLLALPRPFPADLIGRFLRLVPHAPAPWPSWRLVLAALPLVALPMLAAVARMPKGQMRAARGLGAGIGTILLRIWLPQLGRALLIGIPLAILLDLTALILAA